MRKLAFVLLFALMSVLAVAQLPGGFTDVAYVQGLTQPAGMSFAPDGRMFVIEKTGAIKIVQAGKVVSTFAQMNVSTNSERGLLGIALDPDFLNHPYVYVYYTTDSLSLDPPSTPKNRVSRLTANGNTMEAGSEVILLDNIPSDAGNHNAGCLRFAPDGALYVATGDGGQYHANSQDLTNLAGKILRINRDGSIPPSNPFYGSLIDRNEIWCYGLRNPFRFSIRPNTSTLYVGDVGENTWEEVNIGQAGGNYGWNIYEGPTDVPGFISPEFYYEHTQTQSAAITGGCFVVGKRFAPPYDGSYFYGDYVRDVIRRVVFDSNNRYVADYDFTNANTPVDFAEGPDGALYYVSINQGTVRRIAYKTTMNGFALKPPSVMGGQASKGTVTLDYPAPAAGALILLSSTNGASVPTSVRIPGGQTSINFNVSTDQRTNFGSATITASRIGATKSATLKLAPSSDASFVSESVPSTMTAGHSYNVSVTMQNTGLTTWSSSAAYRLLAYNPSGNTRWGFDRIFMSSSASVPTGSAYTFSATVTAPTTPGTYNFQWRMLLNGFGTFGQPSSNVAVTVN